MKIKDINSKVNLRNFLLIDDIFSKDELHAKLDKVTQELKHFSHSPVYLASIWRH